MVKSILKNKLISFFFLIGFIGLLSLRIIQVQFTSTTFIPQKLSININLPSLALRGNLASIQGDVKKKGREDKEFKKIVKKDPILQGESISTGEDGSVVADFQNFGKLSINPDSQIAFVDLIPSEFLVQQSSGTVIYEAINKAQPISIRSLHALISIESGQAKVSVDEENLEITVDILTGNGKIGLVDLDDKTQVFKLEKGQRVVINDENREIQKL